MSSSATDTSPGSVTVAHPSRRVFPFPSLDSAVSCDLLVTTGDEIDGKEVVQVAEARLEGLLLALLLTS